MDGGERAAGVPGAWGGVPGASGGGLPSAWGRATVGRRRRAGRRSSGSVRAAWGVAGRVGRSRRWLAGRVGAGGSRASMASRAGGREERRKKLKGEKKGEERRGPRRRFTYLLCRVPAIRHSAKIFFKFKNKLCRVLAVQALGKDLFYSLC
jgi:hypothetical protein